MLYRLRHSFPVLYANIWSICQLLRIQSLNQPTNQPSAAITRAVFSRSLQSPNHRRSNQCEHVNPSFDQPRQPAQVHNLTFRASKQLVQTSHSRNLRTNHAPNQSSIKHSHPPITFARQPDQAIYSFEIQFSNSSNLRKPSITFLKS